MKQIFSALMSVAALSVCACANLPEAPGANEFSGNYEKLAACYYEQENREAMAGMKFSDLRATKTIIVRREMSDVPLTEASFKELSPSRTSVEVRGFPTIWGPDVHRDRVLKKIQDCAAKS